MSRRLRLFGANAFVSTSAQQLRGRISSPSECTRRLTVGASAVLSLERFYRPAGRTCTAKERADGGRGQAGRSDVPDSRNSGA